MVLCFNRMGLAAHNYKTAYEVEFGETPDTSCMKFQFYQPIRAFDPFATFPNNWWVNGRYLGIQEDAGDDLTFIVEVEADGEKKRLTRSVVQDRFPEGGHPPRIRMKIADTALFKNPRSRLRPDNDLPPCRRRRLTPQQELVDELGEEPLSDLPVLTRPGGTYVRRNDYCLVRDNQDKLVEVAVDPDDCIHVLDEGGMRSQPLAYYGHDKLAH